MSCFRARKDAAPLKLLGFCVRVGCLPSFRARKDAAPLKHIVRLHISILVAAFPRPKGRGPVEANRIDFRYFCNTATFPRPKGRGPVEAFKI